MRHWKGWRVDSLLEGYAQRKVHEAPGTGSWGAEGSPQPLRREKGPLLGGYPALRPRGTGAVAEADPKADRQAGSVMKPKILPSEHCPD